MKSAAERVFGCLELNENIIMKQDTMQQLHTLLCSMKSIKQLPEDKSAFSKIKEKVQFSKLYTSTQTDINIPWLNIVDLIRQEKWIHILGKWKEYMINPDVTMSTLNALSNRHHFSNNISFVPLILSRLHTWTVADQVAIIANIINHGMLDLVEEAMRKHYQNHTVVMASIAFLLDWFLMINRVDKECIWQLKIVGGIVDEIEIEDNGGSNQDWYINLVENETGEELTEDPAENDTFFEPYFKIRDTVDDFVDEYQEDLDDSPVKNSVKAQDYMDQCTKNGMVYRTVDLRPIVHQVMQWLRTITQQQLPDHGRKQIRALAFLQTALNTNNKMRAGLIECGIVPFVVSQIEFNNRKSMLIRTRDLVAQVPCEYTPCLFAYYSLIYEFMTKTDNDVIVAALSEANAITVILDTLKEASMNNSPFEFEFAGTQRKDIYYLGHLNCYKTMENGVPVHNISELAFVVLSKMCIPNRFTIDSRYYKKNMAYFQQHGGFDLLKMGLLSFTNIEQSANAQHNSMSDESHEERLSNLSNLELMAPNPKSQWMLSHSERKSALSNVVTEQMQEA